MKVQLQGSIYSPFFYDALYLYALAVNNTRTQHPNESRPYNDGRAIVRFVQKTRFTGVSGNVDINEYGDRVAAFNLRSLDVNHVFSTFGSVIPYTYIEENATTEMSDFVVEVLVCKTLINERIDTGDGCKRRRQSVASARRCS